jgi:hypothetical protein
VGHLNKLRILATIGGAVGTLPSAPLMGTENNNSNLNRSNVEFYDSSKDMNRDETAQNMVDLARKIGATVVTHWGDDDVFAYPSDTVEVVHRDLDWSADSQQAAHEGQ